MSAIRYRFQQSCIWDGAKSDADPSQPVITIKLPTADVERAKKKLPRAEMGRRWVLLGVSVVEGT